MNNTQSKLKELTVWTTTKCNLKCKYCFVYKLNQEQTGKDMTKETADQLINFANENLEPNGRIWFFGAEPLCNFEIIKYIVEKSKTNGKTWNFGATTNCTLITQEKAQWMKQNNFGILCSVDGPKNSQNTNRVYADGHGSWEEAWRGLSFVRRYLNPDPQLRWTVTPSTVKGLAENIRVMVEEHKLTNLAIDFVYEVEWTQEDRASLKNELELFGGFYKKWMESNIAVFSMFVRDANAAITQSNRIWCSRCGLGQGSVGVDYDGTLYPCHRFIDSHQIRIGDSYKGFDEKRLEWIQQWQKTAPYCESPKKCLTCNYKKACTGGCIAMNYDIFGTPHVNPETFCTIKQLITTVLEDLCKSLQNNTTFQKLYRRGQNAPAPNQKIAQPENPCTDKVNCNKDSQGGVKP